MMNKAGFRVNSITNFAFGAVQIYEARKGYGEKLANEPTPEKQPVEDQEWVQNA